MSEVETAYLAEKSEFVVGQQSVGFVEEEISADELFEAPILALDKAISSLTLCARQKRHELIQKNFVTI